MSFPKLLIISALILFGVIGFAAWKKKGRQSAADQAVDVELVEASGPSNAPSVEIADSGREAEEVVDYREEDLPDGDRIAELFNKREPRLPIVETITYRSHVPWLQGKPAWISDYASHYKTSRHFIARSLNNNKPDYLKQDVADGDKFNVFKEDKNVEFYLLVDVLTSKMWFYYYDADTNERVLLKTYKVGLGRKDPDTPSGSLTPLGTYTLGDRVAIYRPKMMQYYQGERSEMIRTFGTRWIPFAEEVENCTADARGYGIHGLPWSPNEKGELVEEREMIGQYLSDGCIRLALEDIEELFSIIITKPTKIEIVKGFYQAHPPGVEKKT